MDLNAAHAADIEYLVRAGMTRGYQISSLLIIPLYTSFILAKRGRGSLSINRVLRATWVGGLGGGLAGGAMSYAWHANSNEELLRTRRLQTSYSYDRIRANDHTTIGSILMAVLTPAIFWNRAHILNLVLGGAGLGSSIGLLTHYGRSLAGDPPPRSAVPQVKS